MNKYNSVVVFIVCKDEVLMLNRNKKFWMGVWNCVGGKIEAGETHLQAAIRETFEETGIKLSSEDLLYLADLKWYFEDSEADGAYCYLVYINDKEKDEIISTPLKTDEGILDFKKIDWVLHKDNRGVVPDIFVLLTNMLKGTFSVVSAYYNKDDRLIKIESEEGEVMDNIKEGLKKAGYAAVGAGASLYEKGKELYEKVAPKISQMADKGEKLAEKMLSSIGEKYDEFAVKGEEVLKKKKTND